MKIVLRFASVLSLLALCIPGLAEESAPRTSMADALYGLDVPSIDRMILQGADVKATFDSPWRKGNAMVVATAACVYPGKMAPNCAATLRRLLELGVNVDGGPEAPDTPLSLATSIGTDNELVKLLVEAGADINRKDSHGLTPLDHARGGYGRGKMAAYLESRGATGDPMVPVKRLLFEAMWPGGQH